MKRLITLFASCVLSLDAPVAARGDESSGHFTFGITLGLVAPTGDFSADHKLGGMGTGFGGKTRSPASFPWSRKQRG